MTAHVDPLETVRRAARPDGEPERMLPAEAYTSDAVLAWEQRHLFAGSWTCLGRVDDLFPAGEGAVTQRAVCVGDVSALVRARCRRRADVREHLPPPRSRAAAAGRHVAAAQHRVPLPRVDLRPRRNAGRRPRLP